MATFYSNKFEGRVLRLDVTQSGGYANWKLTCSGGATDFYTVYNVEIKINNKTVYNPGTVTYTTQKFPAAKGSISGQVWIGNGTQNKTIYVSFHGSVFYNTGDQYGGNFTMNRYIWAPSLSSLNISNIGDKSISCSFTVLNNNGETPNSPKITLSLGESSPVLQTINARSGVFNNLDPNRQYYIIGSDANSAGRTYTNSRNVTTIFNNPGSPGQPIISYDTSEPIPSSTLKATWTSASNGSTPVAGYRIIIYKNNNQISVIDTDNSNITYTIGTFESLGFVPGDTIKIGLYAYCLDWNNVKHFNGNGDASAQVYSSNSITEVSDKYIYASINGGEFNKYKMYISVNGGDFYELKKDKFKIIQ